MRKTIVERVAEGFIGCCLMGIGLILLVLSLFLDFLGLAQVLLMLMGFALLALGAILATQRGPFSIDIGGPLGFKFHIAGGAEPNADQR